MPETFSGRVQITTDGQQVGELIVRDARGREVFWFGAGGAALSVGNRDNEGDIRIFNAQGEVSIHLDGKEGDVILAGGDCAEYFDLATGSQGIEPGTVMALHDDGKLRRSDRAYDPAVVGVVSGAGSRRPGVVLGARADGGHRALVAVSGTTYCKVDADLGPIAAGDLLTTSETAGYAMRAEPAKAFGSVLGKALRRLDNGRALLPILVTLQ
jgi:hypothetical protein